MWGWTDWIFRAILRALIENYGGGPVGLETLAATTGEDSGTIEDVVEPFLLLQGLLMRTPRGRMATASAYKHLGLKPPRNLTDQALDFDEES